MTLPMNQFNFYLGQGQKDKAKRNYQKYLIFITLSSIIFAIPLYFLLPYTLSLLGSNEAVIKIFDGILVLTVVISVVVEV